MTPKERLPMSKKRTIIEKSPDDQHPDRVIVEESVDPKDHPAVMAYRLSSLENTVKDGFAAIQNKQDEMIKGFVTEKEFAEAKTESDAEHSRLWTAVAEVKADVKGISATTKWWITTGIAACVLLLLVVSTFKIHF